MSARRRYQNLLLATDFSSGAEAALSRVGWLPLGDGGTVHIAHVLPPRLPRKLEQPLREQAEAQLVRSSAALESALAQQAGPRPRTAPVILSGEPFVELIRYARLHGVELVVLGRHGERGVRDHFVGSTAERVVRKGDVPVLLVHGRASGPYARPLAAVDLSDGSRRVLELALALVPGELQRLPLLHAYAAAFESTLSRTWSQELMTQYRRECEQEAREQLGQLIASFGPLEVELEVLLRSGETRTVIEDELLKRRSDLLAVGTHGRTGISHALLGSVAEWLIRAAPCDVAVTRPAKFTFELP
ncbi:MAG TPA: universal stress protein [Aggregicoccus sp.]|nr:universal stress protein [Aggregicoccus sp.]